jgi:predicted nicotinamide N-methyase
MMLGTGSEGRHEGRPELELRAHPFSHGAVSLEVLAAGDLDRLVGESGDPDRLPYWAVVWNSAAALAAWLVDQGIWAERPVLELGCGAGLVGLALAAAGAEVTQTDLFPDAVALAWRNAEHNGLSGIRHLPADWRAWPLAGTWPVVVGSDITYERKVHGALLDVLGRTVAPGGTAYLSDPGRPMMTDFLVRAERDGWSVEIRQASGYPQVHDWQRGDPVFIYTLRSGGAQGGVGPRAQRPVFCVASVGAGKEQEQEYPGLLET